MANQSWKAGRRTVLFSVLLAAALIVSFGTTVQSAGHGNWWNVVPEPENPSSYYDSILYSEIAPKLREFELNSNRVQVEVIGQSAGGRNLFLSLWLLRRQWGASATTRPSARRCSGIPREPRR